MFQCHFNGRITVKRNSSGQHLIHRDAEGIDITLRIRETASGLFRRAVVDRSHDIGIDGVRACRPGNAEVCHLGSSVCRYDDVLRLDVSVNNVVIMRSFKARRHLETDPGGLADRQIPLAQDVGLQRDSLYQFHHDEINPVFFSDIVHVDNVRMRQTCRSLRFHAEFGYKLFIAPKLALEHLDGNEAVQFVVPGTKYICHSA